MLIEWVLVCVFTLPDLGFEPRTPRPAIMLPKDQADDAENNGLSNLQLLLPLLIKGHVSKDDKEIHYPKVNIKDFNPDLQKHKLSDHITNNLAISHDSSEEQKQPIYEGMENMKSVKKQLKDDKDHTDSLNIETKSRPVSLDELKVCNRLLKLTGPIPQDTMVKITLIYCKNLINAVLDKDTTLEESNKSDEEEEEEEIDFIKKDSFVKDSSKEFKLGSHKLNALKQKGHKNLEKKPLVKPWFGPYNGRRDWMVLNEEYPGKMRSYLNKYKKIIF